MFIRVKSKATGHEFDVHEHQFNELKHTRVNRAKYPPSVKPRKTKFRVRKSRALSVSPVGEKGEGDVSDNSCSS